MARYQIVDKKMEDIQIQGQVFAESDNDHELLVTLMRLKDKTPETEFVMIDLVKYRQIIA